MSMITVAQLRNKVLNAEAVTLAIIGDSTTCGFGANPGAALWSNGVSYAYSNYPDAGPNWTVGDPLEITMTGGIITGSVAANNAIPSGTRLLENYLKTLNASSRVYNYGASGQTADWHANTKGTPALLAALTPKPIAAFIALGINSAKDHAAQGDDLRTLIDDCAGADILPIMVLENNIAMDIDSGTWYAPGGVLYSPPSRWTRWSDWQDYRVEMRAIAIEKGILPLLDLGNAAGTIDILKLYDPFHPNAAGYQDIYHAYRAWLEVPNELELSSAVIDSHPIRATRGGALVLRSATGVSRLRARSSGSVRVKTTANGVVHFG